MGSFRKTARPLKRVDRERCARPLDHFLHKFSFAVRIYMLRPYLPQNAFIKSFKISELLIKSYCSGIRELKSRNRSRRQFRIIYSPRLDVIQQWDRKGIRAVPVTRPDGTKHSGCNWAPRRPRAGT